MEGTQIEIDETATFLGLIIDEHLSWKPHCNTLANKISRNCGIMNRVKHLLPESTLKTLFHSLIQSYINYGLLLWGGCPDTTTNRIRQIQKQCIRTIKNAPWRAHTEPRMKQLKILKMDDQFKLQCLIMTHDIIYKNCPDLFCNKFQLNRDQNNYNLRSNNLNPRNLVQPISRTKNNFFVNAPAL